MRKSFTLLFSTLVLLCAFGFSSLAQVSVDVLSPADGNLNVAPTTTEFVVTFNQDVAFTPEGGTLLIRRGSNVVKTIALEAGSPRASISGKKLTVVPGLTFTEGENYSIGISSNAIVNFGGIDETAGNQWKFSIGDYTAPVVDWDNTVPADDASNVNVQATDFALQVAFDDNVVAGTGKKIWLYRADGTIVDIIDADGSAVTVNNNIVTIDINPTLRDELTQYYVNVEKGAFKNANNVEFAGIMDNTTWTFTSRDYTAPFVVGDIVVATELESATLEVTISEPGSVWYSITTSEPTTPVSTEDGYKNVAAGDDNVATVTLEDLTVDTKYTVYVVAQNADGDQQTKATKVEFSTLDNVPPTAIVDSRDTITIDNVTLGLELTFNEKVQAGTGDLLIKDAGNGAVRTVPASELSFVAGETAGTWVMVANFEGLTDELSEKEYFVIIPDGYVEDMSGNAYDSDFTGVDSWTFIASDHTAPEVTVTVDDEVPAADNDILVNFSDDVQLISGLAMPVDGDETAWFPYISLEQNNTVVPFNATYADSTITITPGVSLKPNTTYVVKIRGNVFEDDNGNAFSAVHTSYEVTTKNFSDATIALLPDGSAKVAEGFQPTVTFSKEPFIGGETPVAVTAENVEDLITLKETDSSGDDVAFDVEWDAATYTVTVVPTETLASEGVYYFDFDAATVEDVNGVAFTDPAAVTFTMVDYMAPTVKFSHNGTVEDKAPAAPLTLQFSEPVTISGTLKNNIIFRQNGLNGEPLDFTVNWDATYDTLLVIQPAQQLEKDSVYFYGIGAGVASDGTNTNETAFSTFTFSPAATVPGGVLVADNGYNPAIGATDVKVNSNDQLVAKLTFSEPVKINPVIPDNNDAVLYLKGTEAATEVARVSITGLDIQGSVLTLTFADADATAALLESEGTYYITVDKDVVVANNSNTKTFAGVDPDKWVFTAADIDLPVLTPVSPVGDDLAELDEDLVISSDDAVSVGTGNITIAAGTSDVKTIAVSEEMIDDQTITISHEALTQYNTEYTVTVPAGAFEDEGGNGNAALTWTFTTVANTAPTFVLDPANNEDLVDETTSEFTITFSEEMQRGPNGRRAYLYLLVGDVDGAGNSETNDIEKGYVYVEQGGVTLDSNVVTLNFNAALAADTAYYIVVEQGMFEDVAEPETQVAAFAGITAGNWMFYTYDKTAPTWTVAYDKLGEGMDINSDITITFSKPVDDNGTAITSAQLANLITLKVGTTNIVFSGTINDDKTVVVLENSSFVPALSTIDNYSNMPVEVTLDATIQGVDNNLAIETVTKTFNIADYTAPAITSVTEGTVGGDQFGFDVTANEDGTIYWLVKEGVAETVTAEEVMAGDTVKNYTANDAETVTVTGVQSETQYTLYVVAVDANNNVSQVNSSLSVTTIDITAPVIAGELPVVFDVDDVNDGVDMGTLLLVFNEEVELPADGATAVIRMADTYQLVGEVALAEGTNEEELVINLDVTSFNDSQEFIIEIAGGQVADTTGNTWDGQMGLGENAWVVGLPDRTPALLVDVDPDIAADELVELNEVFTLTFDEEVQLTDNFTIEVKFVDPADNNTDNWELFELIEASGVTIDSNVVTIDFEREFDYSTDYLFTVAYWSLEDMAGNGFRYLHGVDDAGNDVYRTYFSKMFTTVDEADVTAPVATFSPADGDTVTDASTPIIITFDEAIVLRDGSAIDEYDLDTLVYFNSGGTDLAHEATIDATAQTITITPASSLVKGKEYTYGFAAAFADAAENAVAAGEATFVVATDAVDPVYITFDPDNEIAAKATVIPVDQTFRITFNGDLYQYSTLNSENNIVATPSWLEGTTTTAGAITLEEIAGDGTVAVPFEATIESRSAEETVVVIDPVNNLDSETGYVLSVVADKLQYGVGNAFILNADRVEANEYVTVDVVDPLAVDFNPENGDVVGRASTISIVFDELVKAGTGTIEIRHKFGEVAMTVDASTVEVTGKTVEITDLTTLEDGQEYFVLIPDGAITDTTGNAWAGLTEEDAWYFSVSDDLSAPAVTEFAPEGTNVPMETELSITFDRPVDVNTTGNGFIAVYNKEGVAVQLIRVTDDSFTSVGDGSEVTIDLNNDLLVPGMQYFVEVAAETFVSQANDTLYNTAVNRNLWSFTMEINIEPKDPVLTPEDDAVDVPLNTVASMEFNVEVKAGTGEITLRQGGDGTVVYAFDVTSEEVTFDSTTVSFNLDGLLDINTDYYIIVPAGAITNISEQPKAFAGLEQMSSWNFTTTADAYTDVAIADVQGTEAVSPMVDELVRIAGTITAVADTGFFVQDANAAWSGVWVEYADLAELAVGDGVTVAGVVAEVDNVTTIVADEVTVGEATLVVDAIVVDAPSALQDEMYESVLVKVGGAGASGVDDNGQFEIFYELNDSAIVNNWIYATPADSIIAGNYYDVTGVVNGAQDAYTLEPRMVEDIVDITKLTPAVIVPGEVVEFNVYPNPFVNYIRIDNMDKLSRVMVTNIAGQRVIDISYPDSDIRTDGLVNGVYVISLFTEDGMVKSDRIVKR